MNTTLSAPRSHEFSFPRLDALLQVTETDKGVLIRATRDVFNEQQKRAVVRRLAAEGFIAEVYGSYPIAHFAPEPGVRWIVDYRWIELTPEILRPARRFMVRLFLGAVVLWAALIGFLLVRATP